MKEFNSEAHFRNSIQKALRQFKGRMDVHEEARNWVPKNSVLQIPGRKAAKSKADLQIRADFLLRSRMPDSSVLNVWVELKNQLGMHEMATALGQLLIAAEIGGLTQLMFNPGLKTQMLLYLAIPESIWEETHFQREILAAHKINCVHERNIAAAIGATFNTIANEILRQKNMLTAAVRNVFSAA